MEKLTDLSSLRKNYLELAKLFFFEIQKGKTLDEVKELKAAMEAALEAIRAREREIHEYNKENPQV